MDKVRGKTDEDTKLILHDVLDLAIEIAGADFGNLQLFDPESGHLEIVAQRGFPKHWLDYWNTVSKGRGSCGTALASRGRVLIEDVTSSTVFADTKALEIQLSVGIRSIQSTPIFSRSGTTIGIFSTHNKRPGRPQDSALRMLDLLARLAADSIEEAQQKKAADGIAKGRDRLLATLSEELCPSVAAVLDCTKKLRKVGVSGTASKVVEDLEVYALRQRQLLSELLKDE